MKYIPITLLLFALPVVAAEQTSGGPGAREPLNSYKAYTTGQGLVSSGQHSKFDVTSQRKVGGFIVECATAKSKSSKFSLRQPEDPKRDLRNVSFDPITGKAAGFKLFAVNF